MSDQIATLMNQEQLREPEIRLRFLVCSLMEEAFRHILPNCTLYPFGSTVNTFGKRNCDIDMYLDKGTKDGMVPKSQVKVINFRAELGKENNIDSAHFANFSDLPA